MKKALIVSVFTASLLFFYSCSFQTGIVPASYFSSPMKYNFVSEDAIETGEKLQELYPDDDFVYKRWNVTYTFDVNESRLGKEDSKKSSKKKKNKTASEKKKYVGARVTYINGIRTSKAFDENTVEQLITDLDIENSNWPETGVTIQEKNGINVVALNDKLKYQHAIFYNGTTSVSGILGQYAETPGSKFIVPAISKSYEENGIFHSDMKVALMNVPTFVTGNSLQLDYTVDFRDYRYLSTVYFGENHPVKEKVITFEIPEGLDVELLEMNFEGYNITKTEGAPPEAEDDEAFKTSKSKKKKKKSAPKKKKKKGKSSSSSKNVKTINYIIKDLPAMKGEAYNYGPSHSLPHLVVVCKSYTNGTDTTRLMQNTADLYKWYHTLAQKMDNDNKELKKTAEKITADKTTDEEKISAIFYWVQDNIRYIAFEDGLAGFVPDNCQNVYRNRYGDCKGMANLTKEMLKSIGYDARLTWIGTDRIAYDGTLPSLSTANHMICVVYPDSTNKSQRYFLDGTEKFVSFGDYAKRIQGRTVIIEDGENYIVDTIPEFDNLHNKIVKTENYTINNKLIVGNAKRVYNGESKTLVIRSYDNVKLDQRERALRTFLNHNDFNLTVSNINHTDFSERKKPFEISYDIEVKNRVIENGNTLYINLEWDREWANAHIDTSRLTHFSFQHKKNTQKTVTLTIPAGYKINKLPPPVSITTEYFVFNLNYKQQGNTVVYTKEILMPKGYLHNKQIHAWNEAVEKITAFYDNFIILTK